MRFAYYNLVFFGFIFASGDCLTSYRPTTYFNASQNNWIEYQNDTVLNLSSNGVTPAIIILDYGRDVEGYATFQVSSMSGDTSGFEMTYSETYALLGSAMVSPVFCLATMTCDH